MENEILVYTMFNCIFCINQKKWMETNQLQYEERNIIKQITPVTFISVNKLLVTFLLFTF
ncbi:hypothetical protein ABG775_21445 [Peribacillus simplex]|uniref:hypothetical protein n=1 Tax=Peribacillus TaxID=2675229 RepID=UPI00177BC9A9|nr:hypothetical protein [Brevibacillus sp. JNUCC-41]QOS90776.1 hypothetical protein JNUCC41_03095 [Brevibacillus sp. JNUCC-41]